LCDFGISKNIAEGLSESTVKGTRQYMAPELLEYIEPSKDTGSRSNQAADMWALGEIAVRMLTGEQTFPKPPMLWEYVKNPDKFPLDRLPGLDNNVCQFIMGVMMLRPEKRLTSEQALQQAWMRAYESPSFNPPQDQAQR
jgi:serine/threonine protein kinase